MVTALMQCPVSKKLPIALLFLLAIPALHSQTPSADTPRAGIFSGDVKDASGAPIPNATIGFTPQGNSLITRKTDMDGHFAIEARPGDYTLKVMSPGFQTYKHRSIHLVEGQPATENIVLQVATCGPCLTVEGLPPIETINATVTSTIPLLPLPPLKLAKSASR
jgi:Carboxypeptidase regulatory-like domain